MEFCECASQPRRAAVQHTGSGHAAAGVQHNEYFGATARHVGYVEIIAYGASCTCSGLWLLVT